MERKGTQTTPGCDRYQPGTKIRAEKEPQAQEKSSPPSKNRAAEQKPRRRAKTELPSEKRPAQQKQTAERKTRRREKSRCREKIATPRANHEDERIQRWLEKKVILREIG